MRAHQNDIILLFPLSLLKSFPRIEFKI